MVVRNAMDDFHFRHLSDAQMQELNPIIRDAICTAVHAMGNRRQSRTAGEFVRMTLRMIPDYWEEPQLMADYIELDEYLTAKKALGQTQRPKRAAKRKAAP